MSKLKPCPLRKGDIVRNEYAGKNNPIRYFLYLGKGTIKQGRYTHKVYKGICYDGRKIDLFRDTPLTYVGHMEEYDAFIAALEKLSRMEQEG